MNSSEYYAASTFRVEVVITLKMEAEDSSETLIYTHQTTWWNIPEDGNFCSRYFSCVNLHNANKLRMDSSSQESKYFAEQYKQNKFF
jgi:membrane-anchored protein YejM (alkaline phosphatase superfamily)